MNDSTKQGFGVPLWKIGDITKTPSFHGVMTGREAELTLEKHGSDKCYLTRYDKKRNLCFLTVKRKGEKRFIHFMIDITGDRNKTQCVLKGTNKTFDRISDFLHFYENNPVNFEVNGIGDAVQSGSYQQSTIEADVSPTM